MRKLLFNIANRKIYGLLLCTVFVSSLIYAGDMHVPRLETRVQGDDLSLKPMTDSNLNY